MCNTLSQKAYSEDVSAVNIYTSMLKFFKNCVCTMEKLPQGNDGEGHVILIETDFM